MEKLLAILAELRPGVDFETAENLVDNGVLDSFDMVTLVQELNEAYGLEINVLDITPENFNSVFAINKLIDSLLKG